MIDAVIVSTARTPIGKAHRGAFNMTHGAVMGAHALSHAVSRAGIEPGEVEDVILGCGYPEGATGRNIARLSAIRAGMPVSTAATTDMPSAAVTALMTSRPILPAAPVTNTRIMSC